MIVSRNFRELSTEEYCLVIEEHGSFYKTFFDGYTPDDLAEEEREKHPEFSEALDQMWDAWCDYVALDKKNFDKVIKGVFI